MQSYKTITVYLGSGTAGERLTTFITTEAAKENLSPSQYVRKMIQLLASQNVEVLQT